MMAMEWRSSYGITQSLIQPSTKLSCTWSSWYIFSPMDSKAMALQQAGTERGSGRRLVYQGSFPGTLLKEWMVGVDSRSMVTTENSWDLCCRIRQTWGPEKLITLQRISLRIQWNKYNVIINITISTLHSFRFLLAYNSYSESPTNKSKLIVNGQSHYFIFLT